MAKSSSENKKNYWNGKENKYVNQESFIILYLGQQIAKNNRPQSYYSYNSYNQRQVANALKKMNRMNRGNRNRRF